MVRSSTNSSKSKGSSSRKNSDPGVDSGSGAHGGRATPGGGTGAWDGSSSSPDEAFVTRWIIVTDKRAMYAQEEPGWGLDKEKVKTLDLKR